MVKRMLFYLPAVILSAAMFWCLGGCDLLEPPSLDNYSSEELIDELLDRGVESLGDLFGDD